MMHDNFNWSGWQMMNNMMNSGWPNLGMGWSFVFILLLGWSLVWKGMALWKSARLAHKVWFVVLLVTNTVGVFDILYLYVFSKKSKSVE